MNLFPSSNGNSGKGLESSRLKILLRLEPRSSFKSLSGSCLEKNPLCLRLIFWALATSARLPFSLVCAKILCDFIFDVFERDRLRSFYRFHLSDCEAFWKLEHVAHIALTEFKQLRLDRLGEKRLIFRHRYPDRVGYPHFHFECRLVYILSGVGQVT